MKKIYSLILITAIVLSMLTIPAFAAATLKYEVEAQTLNRIGLFNGTGIDEEGNPIFELDRAPTRTEALIMLIRIMGKEQEARNSTDSHPFTDVPEWADKYVAYAYANGITKGIGNGKFGAEDIASSKQYLTFVLRALGYNDNAGDFAYEKASEKAAEIGLVKDNAYVDENTAFLRGDVAKISYDALSVNVKDSDLKLIDKLISDGAVNETAAARAGVATSNTVITKMVTESSTIWYLDIPELKTLFPEMEYINMQGDFNRPVATDHSADYLYKASTAMKIYLTYGADGPKPTVTSYEDWLKYKFKPRVEEYNQFCLITLQDANSDFIAYATWRAEDKDQLIFHKYYKKASDVAAEIRKELGSKFDTVPVAVPFDAVAVGIERHVPSITFDDPKLNEGYIRHYIIIDNSKLPDSVRNYKYFSSGGYSGADSNYARSRVISEILSMKYPFSDPNRGHISTRNETGVYDHMYTNLISPAPDNYFFFYDDNYNVLGYIHFTTPARTIEMPTVIDE